MRKVENYFYEILLLNEILVKYVLKILKIFHLKIYYMKISKVIYHVACVIQYDGYS